MNREKEIQRAVRKECMPKDNRDFFKQKKVWSEVKDELLGCYLVPYFNKILSMGNPILYVDCFAGKGKFDDGKPGSPLTALQSLDRSIEVSHGRYPMPTVSMKFIELNHHQDLETNIPSQHSSIEVNMTVHYANHSEQLTEGKQNWWD